MISNLLVRGMIVGAFAGLLAFGFARVFGEPQVDLAIAFEESMHAHAEAAPDVAAPAAMEMAMASDSGEGTAATHSHGDEEEELVSRPVQAGLGLFTGVVVYGAAFGGIFALVFAFAYGRIGRLDARTVAALLAALGFLSIVIVPMLKYPANPPSVGNAETIGYRTALFMAMLVLSIAATAVAVFVRSRLARIYGGWNATLIAGAGFIVVIAIAMLVLPGINEVPEGFPAALLWRFRVASLGTQAIIWTVLGLAFGVAARKALPARVRG
jgi:predicted cobalt transporter CbtA